MGNDECVTKNEYRPLADPTAIKTDGEAAGKVTIKQLLKLADNMGMTLSIQLTKRPEEPK